MRTVSIATPADIPLIRKLTMRIWSSTYIPIIGEKQVAYMLHQFYTEAALQRQWSPSEVRVTVRPWE